MSYMLTGKSERVTLINRFGFFLITTNRALKKSYQVIILETSTVKITRPLKNAYVERAEPSKEPGFAD